MALENRLQSLLDRSLEIDRVFGISLAVSRPKSGFTWSGTSGNLDPDRPCFIASTTKLYVTAILLQLREEGRIDFESPVSRHLSNSVLSGLHRYRGIDSSASISLRHLMAHTSGLPNYFQSKRHDGKSLMATLFGGEDQGWSFEDTIVATKGMDPIFEPGKKGRAHYSDTNFQLLGRVIEVVEQRPLEQVLRERIFQPLGLKKTALYIDPSDTSPQTFYRRKEPLWIPKAMASFRADGGIISTAKESLAFLEAFFGGGLFDPSVLPSLYEWNPIFFPLRSGVGVHRFQLPWFFDPFRSLPDWIGHSGLSGAFAFHSPEDGTFYAGTVNQIEHPDRSFRLLMKAAKLIRGLGAA